MLSVQFSSVTQSCPTLCNPMECSMSGLPVPHHFLKFAQVHMHYIGDCYPAISFADTLFSFCLQGTFPVSQLFASDDQTTGVSASASVLPRSVQGWFPLGLTGLISLLSKGLSGVLSSTTVRRNQFFGALPSLPSSHLILRCPPLLLPSSFPNIREFSNESTVCISWPKY